MQRYDGKDAVLINDAGGEHLMSPKHLQKWFNAQVQVRPERACPEPAEG